MRTINQLKMVDAKFLEEVNRRAANQRKTPEKMPWWWGTHNKVRDALERFIWGLIIASGLFCFVIGAVTIMHYAINFLLGLK